MIKKVSYARNGRETIKIHPLWNYGNELLLHERWFPTLLVLVHGVEKSQTQLSDFHFHFMGFDDVQAVWCYDIQRLFGLEWTKLHAMPWMWILVDPRRWMEAGAGGQVCWCLYVGHFLAHQHYQFSAFPSLKDGMMQSSQRGKGMGQRRETGMLYTKLAWRSGRGD